MSSLDVPGDRELVFRLLVGERRLELLLPRGVRRGTPFPSSIARSAWIWIISWASFSTAAWARSFAAFHASPPSVESGGGDSEPPTYFWTRSRLVTGTKSRALPAYSRTMNSCVGPCRRVGPALPGLLVPGLGGAPLDAHEAADAVRDVDDDVAPLDLEQRVDGPRVGAPDAAAQPVAVEELVVGDEDALEVLEDEPVVEPAAADLDAAPAGSAPGAAPPRPRSSRRRSCGSAAPPRARAGRSPARPENRWSERILRFSASGSGSADSVSTGWRARIA